MKYVDIISSNVFYSGYPCLMAFQVHCDSSLFAFMLYASFRTVSLVMSSCSTVFEMSNLLPVQEIFNFKYYILFLC